MLLIVIIITLVFIGQFRMDERAETARKEYLKTEKEEGEALAKVLFEGLKDLPAHCYVYFYFNSYTMETHLSIVNAKTTEMADLQSVNSFCSTKLQELLKENGTWIASPRIEFNKPDGYQQL